MHFFPKHKMIFIFIFIFILLVIIWWWINKPKPIVKVPLEQEPTVVIIGAGPGGISAAVYLLKEGIKAENIQIIERGEHFGGVWAQNDYPGSACDIFAHLYSTSFFPRAWSRCWAKQPEIFEYYQEIGRKFNLRSITGFKTTAKECVFDEKKQLWKVTTKQYLDNGTVKTSEIVCNFLISAVGQLSEPRIPPIDGIHLTNELLSEALERREFNVDKGRKPSDFQGAVMHSSQWDHSIDLNGKTVAVVGTGASAIQIVPELQKIVGKLIVFQSSRNWVLTKDDFMYYEWVRWIFKNIPFVAMIYRCFQYLYAETFFTVLIKDSISRKLILPLAKLMFVEPVYKNVSEKVLSLAKPEFPFGCRRVLFASNWYTTLSKQNVELVASRAVSARPDALQDASGQWHKADVVVLATGFRTTEFLASLNVIGRGGKTLKEVFKKDGQVAHLGIDVPEFPNFFMAYGPGTNLGHNSILIMLEAQARYFANVIGFARVNNIQTIELKRNALMQWKQKQKEALKKMVWGDGCRVWYKDEKTGENPTNYAFSTINYLRETRKVNFENYKLTKKK